MALRRVFAAVELSDRAREAVADQSNELRHAFRDAPVRWERPEKYHLTLRFEPKADEATLAELEAKLTAAAQETPQFELAVSGTGAFVNRRGPAVLWIGVEQATADILSGMARDLGNAGRFHPHITIARIKHADAASELIDRHRDMALGPIAFIVRELVLIESTLTPMGSVYNVLLRVPMAAA